MSGRGFIAPRVSLKLAATLQMGAVRRTRTKQSPAPRIKFSQLERRGGKTRKALPYEIIIIINNNNNNNNLTDRQHLLVLIMLRSLKKIRQNQMIKERKKKNTRLKCLKTSASHRALCSSFRNPPPSPGIRDSSRGPSRYQVEQQQGWRSRHTGRGHTGQGGRGVLGGQGVQLVLSPLEDRDPRGAHL